MLNGTARSNDSYEEIDPIWADDPLTGKKNIQPLIDRALELCD